MPRPIDSLELFYAHALAIEHEAMQRYDEFHVHFDGRGEEVLAGLCATMAREERRHYAQLLRTTQDLELPDINAVRYQWIGGTSPEAPAAELFYRVATPMQLLEVALAGEVAARRFFRWVTRTSRDPSVRNAARLLAREEAAHVRWVMDAMQYREPTAAIPQG